MSFRIRSKVSNPQKVFKDDINTYNVIVPESNSRDTTILQLTEERKKRKEVKINLCHCHNVGRDPLSLKRPKVAPSASKTCLNLISNTQASCFLYTAINRRQVTRGQFYNPPHSLSYIKMMLRGLRIMSIWEELHNWRQR